MEINAMRVSTTPIDSPIAMDRYRFNDWTQLIATLRERGRDVFSCPRFVRSNELRDGIRPVRSDSKALALNCAADENWPERAHYIVFYSISLAAVQEQPGSGIIQPFASYLYYHLNMI